MILFACGSIGNRTGERTYSGRKLEVLGRLCAFFTLCVPRNTKNFRIQVWTTQMFARTTTYRAKEKNTNKQTDDERNAIGQKVHLRSHTHRFSSALRFAILLCRDFFVYRITTDVDVFCRSSITVMRCDFRMSPSRRWIRWSETKRVFLRQKKASQKDNVWFEWQQTIA